jgi:hypothetical protein
MTGAYLPHWDIYKSIVQKMNSSGNYFGTCDCAVCSEIWWNNNKLTFETNKPQHGNYRICMSHTVLNTNTKVKAKLSLCFNWVPRHEGVLGEWRYSPHSVFDLGTRWRWVVSCTSQPLYPPGKSPKYPLDRGLGGHQRRSGRGDEEKNY